MSLQPDNRDEERLRALFDGSYEPPSEAVLTRLKARAADVPSMRPARFWPGWIWAPGFAGVALAATVAVFALTPESSSIPKTAAVAGVVPAVRVATSGGSTLQAGGAAVEGAADELALHDATLAGIDTDWASPAASDSELGTDVFDGVPPDADLDAWMYATAELLDTAYDEEW
ncbi:MAG TPA: hypothetical protein VKZ49_17640 [Polyangiaceae bacterium]|nr:hypothetical protein [Polyangiaceae bacterium]